LPLVVLKNHWKIYNLGHIWLRLSPPPAPTTKLAYFYDKLHVESYMHVALLNPPLPQLNVELVSWYITKSCFGVVYDIELGAGLGGGKGETKFVLSMFELNNFVMLSGMVSSQWYCPRL
jgi:hypothetical protein